MPHSRPTKAIQRHWDKVGDLPCIVSGYKPATLHHCHGGSMMVYVHKGLRQKTSDWLVIPLAPKYHCDGGPFSIDGPVGVVTWEETFGEQVEHLDEICRLLSYNVWRRAGIARDVEGVCCF